jgi:two-component system, NarL family, invasion response regulator UvrY
MELDISIIDDHSLISESLAVILRQCDFVSKVHTYGTPAAFINSLNLGEIRTDIIISDMLMPEINGLDLIQQVRKWNKEVKIIILSAIGETATIRTAIKYGANGYLTKSVALEEFSEALKAVYSGELYIAESLRKSLMKNIFVEDKLNFQLSPREKEVLKWICSGKTIKEAAFEMKLSAYTVQTYYRNLMKKLNINRTADMIVFAIQNGLYEMPPSHH